MKINWGTKLAFFAILFMSFVVFMVIRISQTDVPLVEENYYEKGIDYQQSIDNSKNADSIVNVRIGRFVEGAKDKGKHLFLNKYTLGDTLTGTVHFYRASDKSKDFTINFALMDTIPTALDISSLDKGKWKLTLIWNDKTGKHLIEKEAEL